MLQIRHVRVTPVASHQPVLGHASRPRQKPALRRSSTVLRAQEGSAAPQTQLGAEQAWKLLDEAYTSFKKAPLSQARHI